MSQLTLRDLATNEEIIVPPDGFVFGRTGGDADIQIEDPSISRRQARVSNRQGSWVLEVMVVPPGQRLPRPQPLQEGQAFFIGQSEFEVVAIEGGDDDAVAKTMAPTARNNGRAPAPVAAPAAAPARKAAPAPAKAAAPAAAPARKAAAAPSRPPAKAARVQEEDEAPADDAPEGEGDVEGGAPKAFDVKALFVGVPKGIAYYMVNVPKLLFNPLGTVRSTIEEQPAAALGTTGLIGYALPSMLATNLLGSIAGGIATLIAGGGFSIMAFIPIVPAISAVIGAVITGFIWHPVLKWIINFLKGESDEKSRSNYFLQMQTMGIVLAVPNALGLILGAVRLPFINLVGPLLMTVASVVMIFVVYQWFVYFKVVQWFKYVLLALGALSVIGASIGFVTGLISNIRSLGSGSSSSASAEVDTSGADEAYEAAMKNADEATREQMKAARAAQKAALEAAAKAGAGASAEAAKAIKEAQENAAKMAAKATEDAAKATKKAAAAAEAAEEAAAAPAKEAKAGKKAPPPAAAAEEAEEHAAAPAADSGGGSYGTYARRREAIEKRLDSDPTVLAGDDELRKTYQDYLEAVYDIDTEYAKKPHAREHQRLNDHLKNAELFKKTGSMVDKIAGKLGVK